MQGGNHDQRRQQAHYGKRKLTEWCWRFVSRFTSTINDENVACLVKKADGIACNHLMKWTLSEGNKRGTGTSGMTTHIQNSCPAERNFSALAHLIGDLRSNMLASKVERMIILRLNRHLVVTRLTSWTPRTHRHELG